MAFEDLKRFLDPQNETHQHALAEIKRGRKTSHWMWYIFPQLKGLGRSEAANFYGIKDLEEATAYLAHPILGKNLLEIAQVLLDLEGRTANQIFGTPDDLKLKSCLTLFAGIKNASPIFNEVLLKYFDGKPDALTLRLLETQALY